MVVKYLHGFFYAIYSIVTWSYQIKSVVSCSIVFKQRVKNVPLYVLFYKKYNMYEYWTRTELREDFTFPKEKTFEQFDDIVY